LKKGSTKGLSSSRNEAAKTFPLDRLAAPSGGTLVSVKTERSLRIGCRGQPSAGTLLNAAYLRSSNLRLSNLGGYCEMAL